MAQRATTGTKGTCQHCEKSVIFQRRPGDTYWNDYWRHIGTDSKFCSWATDEEAMQAPWGERGTHAMPMEWCPYQMNDGRKCHRAVKPEDITAKMYACGIHMKLKVAEIEQMERLERSAKQAEEREEIAVWERSVYADAADQLRRVFGPHGELLKDYTPESRYRSKGHVQYTGEFDVMELWAAVQYAMNEYREAPDAERDD